MKSKQRTNVVGLIYRTVICSGPLRTPATSCFLRPIKTLFTSKTCAAVRSLLSFCYQRHGLELVAGWMK